MISRLPGRGAGLRTAALTMALAGTAGMLLAACGSVAGQGSAGPAQPGSSSGGSGSAGAAQAPALLCERPSAVLSVRIMRLTGPMIRQPAAGSSPGQGAGSQDAAGQGGPNSVSVSPTMARNLAVAACDLPVLPPGVRHCPIGLFEQYELFFTAPDRVYPVVIVQPTGCQQLTGLGQPRSVVGQYSFLAQLARAAAIAAPITPVRPPAGGNPPVDGTPPLTGKPVHKL